jgi:hypothetical protein
MTEKNEPAEEGQELTIEELEDVVAPGVIWGT